MFTTIIVRPIFNLLVAIYAILPGHDFGLAIIIFTIVVRLLMWPLVKKQLRQAKAMRELQPEIKRIKKAAAGNKQKESKMVMELYKEREVSPFGSIGTLIIQLIVLIGLYSGLRKVVYDPGQLVTFSYPFLRHLSWMRQIAATPHDFNNTLFGLVNLNRSALSKGGIYWPAMVIVVGSAISQFYQSKQLLPTDANARKLKDILKDAGKGSSADQSEVNAAVGRSTRYFLPVMIFLFTVNYPSALSLYWLVGGVTAFIQQSIVLREDVTKLEAAADKPSKDVSKIVEAEVVETPPTRAPSKKPKTKKSSSKAKRRKR
ncbi:MAG TPA: YidC/Oxa1 family membrane protein insertase [Candidatus Saccharimonadales bacterium]|nr:YidC/Oxa1 family membrane protein insertase [Candidatus Saccharimonadales bacterium]